MKITIYIDDGDFNTNEKAFDLAAIKIKAEGFKPGHSGKVLDWQTEKTLATFSVEGAES